MGPEELAAALRERARELGFDALGVAAARRLDRDGDALARWLSGGRHAGMHWMARDPERRSDPRRLLPGCESVVVLAMNYWPGPERSAIPDDRARVALYARGRDYHKVLSRKIRAIARWLDERTGAVSRAFVDTGPVLERAWAERAGVGWIGKNANLLTRDRGSWLLIGEILTTAKVAPAAAPHEEFCGSCTACIDACPTGAIVADGVVDSNRCISYWTIEHRGPIPRPQREGLADWIFGCDVCQDVCPWNLSFSRPVDDDPFSIREDLRGLDPLELLRMDEDEFRRRYAGTSLMRAKWEGMRRNACVVIGNRARPEDVPALVGALGDEDAVVAAHAVWALARIGGATAREALVHAWSDEARPEVADELRRAVAERGGAAD